MSLMLFMGRALILKLPAQSALDYPASNQSFPQFSREPRPARYRVSPRATCA